MLRKLKMSKYGHIELSSNEFSPANLQFLTFKSPSLGRRGDVTLFVPPNCSTFENLPLILLLHGVYDSHWAWTMKGGVHLTALQLMAEKKIAPAIIAMPSDGLFGDGSGYFAHNECDYENWIVEDVPNCLMEILPNFGAHSKLFIAGLSMGGFGALRLGAKYAEKFSGFSGHSALTKAAQLADFVENPLSTYGNIESDELSVIYWMIKNKQKLPPFRFDCGTEDGLLNNNRELNQQLIENHINHIYQEFRGSHDWNYWKRQICETLLFFNANF